MGYDDDFKGPPGLWWPGGRWWRLILPVVREEIRAALAAFANERASEIDRIQCAHEQVMLGCDHINGIEPYPESAMMVPGMGQILASWIKDDRVYACRRLNESGEVVIYRCAKDGSAWEAV
jgi:hypothetical protein